MHHAHGVTLLELVIVLAIVATLAAIAYPSYTDHVVRARRGEGQAALLAAMQEQERYFGQHRRYLAFSSRTAAPVDPAGKWWSGSQPRSSAYELQGVACQDQTILECIELTAKPGTAQVDASFFDGRCGTLSLSSTGERGAGGPVKQCWP